MPGISEGSITSAIAAGPHCSSGPCSQALPCPARLIVYRRCCRAGRAATPPFAATAARQTCWRSSAKALRATALGAPPAPGAPGAGWPPAKGTLQCSIMARRTLVPPVLAKGDCCVHGPGRGTLQCCIMRSSVLPGWLPRLDLVLGQAGLGPWPLHSSGAGRDLQGGLARESQWASRAVGPAEGPIPELSQLPRRLVGGSREGGLRGCSQLAAGEPSAGMHCCPAGCSRSSSSTAPELQLPPVGPSAALTGTGGQGGDISLGEAAGGAASKLG
jgi:hypothetical protein